MRNPLNHRATIAVGAFLTVAALIACALPAGSAPPKGGVSDLDKNFLIAVNKSNLSEVAYAPTVTKRAASQDAKDFSQYMVHDHTKANRQVVQLASSLGVKLPHRVPDDEQAVIDRLGQEHGTQFDRAYKSEMIRDHLEDISNAEREVSLGRNAQVKACASQLLVTLRQHLRMARNMKVNSASSMNRGRMGGSMSGSTRRGGRGYGINGGVITGKR